MTYRQHNIDYHTQPVFKV